MSSSSLPRNILLTGASTGIGRATALHLAARGWHVLAGIRKPEDGEVLLQAGASGHLEPVLLDVTRDDHIQAFVDGLNASGRPLHGLINNAGFNYMSPFEGTEPQKIEAVMATNLFGLAHLTRALLPYLRAGATLEKPAHILNLGSIGSLIGIPWEAWYHASKFALLGLSESLQNEVFAQNIKVSVVCPGGIRTPFVQKSEAGAEDSLAGLTPELLGLYQAGMRKLVGSVGMVERFGSDPIQVARAIEGILVSRNPPFRRLVGTDAQVMAALQAILPRRMLHALLRGAFGG